MKKESISLFGKGGIKITSTKNEVRRDYKENIISNLDKNEGAYFCSSFEYPGRYTRWDIGFVNPPVGIKTFGNEFNIFALNDRGIIITNYILEKLEMENYLQITYNDQSNIKGIINHSDEIFPEEKRSKQPSVFSLIRTIREAFFTKDDRFLGLYGAFGYDLIFQFEKMQLIRERNSSDDMVLYIPDEIFVIDHQRDESFIMKYEFEYAGNTTNGVIGKPLMENKDIEKDETAQDLPIYEKGNYAKKVQTAMEYFKRGDFFEVVPSHTFYKKCTKKPSQLFRELKEINPSPYGFLINLGKEHLIGASPEMYVRVEGKRVETCPISGTIRRGKNAVEDAQRIKELINSKKDESELTMCTDVDRNDKSRICVPGTVKVIGRRQIEMYSHLIHTVDHVEGILEDEYDSLDAFMTHMWAVTVTGAPKRSAVSWIEKNEDSNRAWYGGAVGHIGFDGNINTGLTLRTMRLANNIASVRVGATVLFDSIPADEEEETIVKAMALMKVIEGDTSSNKINNFDEKVEIKYQNLKILFVDHEDSFVHTLASYFRKFGCAVETLRHNIARERLANNNYDLVVLSPGPGSPSEFKLSDTIDICIKKKIPIFGVCLGLQGIVEYYGGELGTLEIPVHGKQSELSFLKDSFIFDGICTLKVGRYHSLYAKKVPDCLKVSAQTDDGVVMAIENENDKVYAVQFHPESIMSIEEDSGMRIIQNVLMKIGG